jgi:hypothetical protein
VGVLIKANVIAATVSVIKRVFILPVRWVSENLFSKEKPLEYAVAGIGER